MPEPRASVLIAAAGTGRRFAEAAGGGGALSKVFADLAGRPVLAYVLEAFWRVEAVAEVVVAVPETSVEWARGRFGETGPAGRPLCWVAGGADRTESVARALAASDPALPLVAVHDGARPLIRSAVIAEALRVAAAEGAAVVGRPVDHTVKRVGAEGRVLETVPRGRLWLAQTPQVFRREVIEEAYRRRGEAAGSVTDDAQLVEALGRPVRMVRGEAANIKITTPEDLRLCEALLVAGWSPEG